MAGIRIRKNIILLIFLSLLLSACGFGDKTLTPQESQQQLLGTMVALTMSVSPPSILQTQVVPPIQLSETPLPSFTVTLTPTRTPTPTAFKPFVMVSYNTNCRSGPGVIYDYVGSLLVGETAEIVGRSPLAKDYWVIKNPDRDGVCWLWGEYAIKYGNVDDLPSYEIPPTPTPTFTATPSFYWEGTWNVWIYDGPLPIVTTLTVDVDGFDFTASGPVASGSVSLLGVITSDYQTVTGTWDSTVGSEGNFTFYSLGLNQFQGHYTGLGSIEVLAWCGARAGFNEPSPCLREY